MEKSTENLTLSAFHIFIIKMKNMNLKTIQLGKWVTYQMTPTRS